MSASQPTVLDITSMQNGYRFCLVRPGEPFLGPARKIWDVSVGHANVKKYCGLIAQEIEQENSTDSPASFAGICEALLAELLSENTDPRIRDLREALRTLDSPLLIQTDAPGVYWELLKDGDDDDAYLAMRCDVGRSLKTQSVPRAVPRPDANFRCLLIADPDSGDPYWGLPDTASEAVSLRQWLEEKHVDCTDFLCGEDATFGAVLQMLARNTYDIIHYAGHVFLDQASKEYAIRLRGGELFLASSIRKQVKGAPLVFLNSCWSCKSDGAAKNWSGSVEGLTNAFLEAGAQLVVGSLFEVPDTGSRLFAEKFYECVLGSRPIGEAMRLARYHVRGKPDCGAAWASFVLYGDPCLKIEVRVDRLSKALQAVGLSREDFETSCLKIVEQAIEYANGNSGVATTVHLFAALVGGDKTHLRDTLEAMGVPPKALVDAFKHLFRYLGNAFIETESIELSPNVGAILGKARELSLRARCARVGELDVVEAFAQHGGGAVGEVLKTLGVDIGALAPSGAGRKRKPNFRQEGLNSFIDAVGPLKCDDCTEATWQVLADAALLASQMAKPLLGTPQLLTAMLRGDTGPLAVALRRIGVNPPPIDDSIEWSPPGKKALNVECSSNAASILGKARLFASDRVQKRVDAEDLLHALVQNENGAASVFLREKLGLTPDLLLSALFDETGTFLTDKVDQGIQRCLQKAADCARKKGHAVLARVHLIYGMLANAESDLASLVRSTGIDAGKLADLLFVQLVPAPQTADVSVALTARSMSQGILRLLRAAEIKAQTLDTERVNERNLVLAVLADGCGSGGAFMIAHGVNWSRVTELAEQAQTRQLH